MPDVMSMALGRHNYAFRASSDSLRQCGIHVHVVIGPDQICGCGGLYTCCFDTPNKPVGFLFRMIWAAFVLLWVLPGKPIVGY